MKLTDYSIFNKWYPLLNWMLERCQGYPKHARFTVGSRIAGLALDFTALLVEAVYTRERKPVLQRANLLLEQMRVLFRVSADQRYLSLRQYEYVSLEINEVGRMLGGWIHATESKSPV